ncbi:phospho-sugar mutase [Actinocrinis puniceicyclus]|uniref:Phospho-sugar mutase n=1 Tax=Actinocrinis puniceicyclus TaxID=977794 RepID=A0A8J7WGK2_9ACTN|nr:phospho-sugar mutase [Actinocrinis puniceicyclus]MBS2961768.1 phospho-sugar mutase [Actinocrinis puniceicyclus]
MENLLARARAWLDEDPDPETREELRALIDACAAGDEAAADACGLLADQFSGTLQFGTAGLRGALGAGPNRMNRVVVSRAAAGLARYLRDNGHVDGAVVVGYDARKNSDVFARDTAQVLSGAGLHALLLPKPLPTPVLAFAIRYAGACAGVMVTASHNPPRDNGYKVYLGDGSQITPPADEQIAAAIAAVGPMASIPRDTEWETLDDSIVDAYLDRAVQAVDAKRLGAADLRGLRVVSTALHGVGGAVLAAAFERAGFAKPVPVPEQQDPDPTFHTVAFPNPEEPGAIDLALALAEECDADLVIANDPDADRCAVAVPVRAGRDGPAWRMLRGDEVGALLGAYLAERGGARVFATTIVSSSLLGQIARRHGIDYRETLTGFKWLAKVEGLTYAYEEALGYCVDPDGVRDKDGISAALLIAELVATLKADGRGLEDELERLAAEYGRHATDQLSIRVDEPELIERMMAGLRSAPPKELAGLAVARVDDLSLGSSGVPPTDGLRLALEGGARVVVRPSGTEPKLKCYIEVVTQGSAADAAARLDALKRALAQALGG